MTNLAVDALATALNHPDVADGEPFDRRALAIAILSALPANAHLVIHDHDDEDIHGCRECDDALDAGRLWPQEPLP
jgi:hypothetical protein